MAERPGPLRFARAGIRGLEESATLSVNDRVRALRREGQTVFHLAFGESRFPVHPTIARALAEAAQSRSYLPALGIPELREAIADHYRRTFDLDVSPEQVVTGPGSKSLIFATLMALGEEVIIPQPSWVTYGPQAHLLSKPVTWVPTRREHDYQLDLEVLDGRIADSRRSWGNPEVLIVNSPGNPTGTMASPERVRALSAYARENGLVLVSDEIYALTAYGDVPHVSPARFYPEGTIVMGGLSKSLSLGGWRIGVAVLPPGRAGAALRDALQTIASNIWSCVTAPVQYAAVAAYQEDADIDAYVTLCTEIHGIRTRHLHGVLADLGVPCARPDGAFYVFPCFEPWRDALRAMGIENDVDLASYLLERYRIAALPGSSFFSAQDLCLRLSSSFIDAGTDGQVGALLEAYRESRDPENFLHHHHPEFQAVSQCFADFVGELERRR